MTYKIDQNDRFFSLFLINKNSLLERNRIQYFTSFSTFLCEKSEENLSSWKYKCDRFNDGDSDRLFYSFNDTILRIKSLISGDSPSGSGTFARACFFSLLNSSRIRMTSIHVGRMTMETSGGDVIAADPANATLASYVISRLSWSERVKGNRVERPEVCPADRRTSWRSAWA